MGQLKEARGQTAYNLARHEVHDRLVKIYAQLEEAMIWAKPMPEEEAEITTDQYQKVCARADRAFSSMIDAKTDLGWYKSTTWLLAIMCGCALTFIAASVLIKP